VDEEVRARVLAAHARDVRRADARVDVALAVPHVHRAADRLLHVGAEEHVGPKRISVSGPWLGEMCSTTATALAEVTQ
jgi:hypothetical protein